MDAPNPECRARKRATDMIWFVVRSVPVHHLYTKHSEHLGAGG